MRSLIPLILVIVACSSRDTQTSKEVSVRDEPINYVSTDLRKISWIEGNWRGMAGDNPFYEIYKITNDSTLEITTYVWNGTDSSKSASTYIKWDQDAHYLGDNRNWKVTSIADDSITMVPANRGPNTIVWKRTGDGWTATLGSKKGKVVYDMKRVEHFR